MESLDEEPKVKHAVGWHGSTAYYLLIIWNTVPAQHPAHDCLLWNAKALLMLISTKSPRLQKREFLHVAMLSSQSVKEDPNGGVNAGRDYSLSGPPRVLGKLTGPSMKVKHST